MFARRRLFKGYVYTIAWGLFLGGNLIQMVAASQDFALTLLVVFAVIEALAVIDSDAGDTLSEHVWAFLRDPARPTRAYRARVLFAGGFVAYLGFTFLFAVTGEPALALCADVAFTVGLVGWLYRHFALLGREG